MRDSEEGSSTAVAFALAGVLFIGAISTVLVYTNDRIPPPAKTRPHQEYGSEAHVLLQSIVLGCGTAVWDVNTEKWTEYANTVTVNNVLGLRYDPAPATDDCEDPGAACLAPVCLDFARITALATACPSPYDASLPPAQRTCLEAVVEQDGKYDYDDLRQILDLDKAERDFRIVIVDLDASEEVLLDYGNPIPGRTATQPATAYVELQDVDEMGVAGPRDGHIVRVAVHVFHS